MDLLHKIFPPGADYPLLVCILLSGWLIPEICEAWPAAAAEFRELEAQRRHRKLLRRLKDKR